MIIRTTLEHFYECFFIFEEKLAKVNKKEAKLFDKLFGIATGQLSNKEMSEEEELYAILELCKDCLTGNDFSQESKNAISDFLIELSKGE